MRLKLKIWLMLGVVISVVLAVDLDVSYRKLHEETRQEIEYDAKTVFGFMMATRRIYQQQFIASGLPVDDRTIGFLPAHSFSRISKDFANWNKNGIVFNNVSDVPRNPGNRADRHEMEAIAWFRANPKATQRLTQITADNGIGYLLFTAPIRIEPFCLKCHGDREAAPPSIRERYADAYGYRVGDLRGVVSIRVPTAKFEGRVWDIWSGQLVKSLVGYATIFLALGLILDHLVVGRLSRLKAGAEQIADGSYGARISEDLARSRTGVGRDEIESLAATFNRMADEVQSRDLALRKLSQAVEQSPAHIVITDLKGRIEYVNAAFVRDTGYTREELLGANPRMLKSGKTPPDAYANLWSALTRGDVWEGEFINRCKDGREFIESAIVAPVRDGDGTVTHYLAVKQDITDRKRAEAEIHNLAYFDPLTNLPNRRLLMDRLEQSLLACRRSKAFGALLILDLDNFKALNDTRGHDVGDLLLKEVAIRLAANVRQEDTVARLGGDEYVLILENLGWEEATAAHLAEMISEKMRAALDQPYALGGFDGQYEATASIGITLFHDDAQTCETLLKQADVALYQAKDSGRNLIRFFNPAMQAAIDARAALESALRQAVNRNELRLHYQPQVDGEGRIVGAEALLRWVREDGTLVSPGEFIPLAEESGLILPMGEWVFRTACAQLRAWSERPETRNLSLAINVSGRQFHQGDFVARLAGCLANSGADPSRLKLELTESVVLDNLEEVIQRMRDLRALGVRFSLDDFGTGYSALSYLKRLPLDQIKIDQSFVRDIGVDPNDAAIVGAILAMSRSLGLDVVAEGVETQEQRTYLVTNGCATFQGYLFGRPMPIEALEGLLREAVA
ncbi:MAG TPA: EAL domain-containing protein [Thiobacillaceae bacterium]|nr:EAL domain-containing protein [Thiobacillaceae bacterium]HNA81025.1 EAL domain-containing protein [Thiobacillaceae bacterium]HNF87893.1 EAL domain-containing protein [Thiobacillaceae bacterium]HNH89098.1 EAL domain-containing protein [Thiobacillaceae bacterium]HNI07380.1 EAL domain-containing protein [Thiobacillaceae bacterium]